MDKLQQEMETYNRRLPELLANAGKYVLISGDDVEGFFEAYADALTAGYTHHPDGRFMVKRVAVAETAFYFTRDIAPVVACRA